ncbi:MAG TPA: serine hydrolase [Ignavibacteria bacterium]|nr:serine hydrolase [Ignavibacteria bacterium]
MYIHTAKIILFFLISVKVYAQTEKVFEPVEITDSIHKSNIGKIKFMPALIPTEEYSDKSFLKEFEFKQGNNFFIRVFMGNTLTNYLHQLQSELSKEQLTENGNFQFTFYIDDSLAYAENLNPGAFGKENKNTKTAFTLPLENSDRVDSWGWYLWNRLMMKAGYDALTPGEHNLKIEIRPYIKAPDVITGELIAEGEIKLKIEPPEDEQGSEEIQKINPGSGWKISNDTYDRERIKELNLKIVRNLFKNITGIIVIKNGELLIEEYFNGADRNSLHDMRSVGKSIASALMGIAIKEGYIKNENQCLKDFYDLSKFENYTQKKDSVTIKSLLTMSSAFDADDNNEESSGNEENMYDKDNWVEWALNLPMSDRKIGNKWAYFTGGAVVLGDIIDKNVPEGIEKFAAKKLFFPLGIHNYKWKYTPQNIPSTAGGLELTALDFAKFGQMYKNKGKWSGKQILPPSWVTKSFQPYQQTDYGDNYGYLFWNKIYEIDGKKYETYYCGGNGGNKIFIFNDQPLVVVITATAYNMPYMHVQTDKIMERYILKALMK